MPDSPHNGAFLGEKSPGQSSCISGAISSKKKKANDGNVQFGEGWGFFNQQARLGDHFLFRFLMLSPSDAIVWR